MVTRLRLAGVAVAAVVVLCTAAPASAQGSFTNRFTGQLTGTEPTFDSPYCGTANAYAVVTITPAADATYYYRDISIDYDIDMQVDLYQGTFDPAAPAANHVAGWDDWDSITLVGGQTYHLVVSQLCGGSPVGTWDFILVGPESLALSDERTFLGAFTGTEPVFTSPLCGGDVSYQVVGPVSVSAPGEYFYRDISIDYDVDMMLGVHRGAFDPANPAATLLAEMDDWNSVTLVPGEAYYFVTAPLCSVGRAGTWEFAMVGPGSLHEWTRPVPELGSLGVGVLIALLLGAGLAVLRWRAG